MSKQVSPSAPTVYTTADLLRLTTATKGELIHWGAIRLIQPDIQDTKGSGHHKRFSALNVVEVEIAAALNKFQIPTALIGRGLDEFRMFHQTSVALWRTGPLDGERWTNAQCAAFAYAWCQSWRHRYRRARGKYPSAAAAKSVLEQPPPDDGIQRDSLQMAARWVRILSEPLYQGQHFFGLFVNPLEDEAVIADEPLNLSDTMTYAVVVVNLGAVIAALQDDGAVDMRHL